MRSYERNGVTVDQCSGCRGVFLDRGELERLVDAEGAYYDQRAPAPMPPPEQRRESEPMYNVGGFGHGHGHGHRKHKRESFLSELFD